MKRSGVHAISVSYIPDNFVAAALTAATIPRRQCGTIPDIMARW